MSNLQLVLTIAIPSLLVLVGIFLNNARFNGIDSRFNGIDARFNGIEARLASMEGDLRQFYRDLGRTLSTLKSVIGRNYSLHPLHRPVERHNYCTEIAMMAYRLQFGLTSVLLYSTIYSGEVEPWLRLRRRACL